MPAEPLLLLLDLFDDFSRGPGLTVTRVSLAPPDLSSVLTSIGTRDLSPFGESLWQRGLAECQVVMVSRSTGLYLTGYICCPNSLVPTQPLPPPACPASSGPCCPCSPRSSCTIVVWATGYFLLGAKDYSVIRNVCLSGRLRNKDYK